MVVNSASILLKSTAQFFIGQEKAKLFFFHCLLHTLGGDKIIKAQFVLNKKTFGHYTLKGMLQITHDVLPLKNDKHTNHHTVSSAYLTL
jgi:hypothetical protein